jgi:anti-sigma regulatory factor (Ser/Thr protein kinase)
MSNTCRELTLPAQTERLPEVLAFVEEQLEEAGCPMKAQMQISVATEEVYVNIASYAYAPGSGMATIRLELTQEPAVVLTFIDSGIAFNPLEKEDPNVNLPAEERQIGGLGIFMTKKTMDEVRYERAGDRNVLTLIKRI